MSLAQSDIDALLAAASDLTEQVPADSAPAPDPSPGPAAPKPTAPRSRNKVSNAEIKRILKLCLPVTVVLADQDMPVGKVLEINTGSIIEFVKPFDAELDLVVNNCRIATGQAVKVGENFGLRLTQIGDLCDTLQALSGR